VLEVTSSAFPLISEDHRSPSSSLATASGASAQEPLSMLAIPSMAAIVRLFLVLEEK
jgi:hypothetical protein